MASCGILLAQQFEQRLRHDHVADPGGADDQVGSLLRSA